MAVDINEIRRQRVLDALAPASTLSWSQGSGNERVSFNILFANIRTRERSQLLTIALQATYRNRLIFEDRINLPNPPTQIRDINRILVDNPLQAIRSTLSDVVKITTKGLTVPRLERNPDGSFRGDTLAVRSGTNDGRVGSTNTTFATMAAGSGLSANTTEADTRVVWGFDTVNYLGDMFFIDFDTSSLLAGATISAAVITLYGAFTGESDVDNYNLEARYKDWGGTVTTADWFDPRAGVWSGLVSGGNFNTSVWVQTEGTANNLSDSGVYISINKIGTTSLVVGFSGMDNATPTGMNRVFTHAADEAGTAADPLFTITYTPAKGFPFRNRQFQRSQLRR